HLSDTSLLCPPNRVKLRTTPITCFMAHPPPVHPHARGDDFVRPLPSTESGGTPPRAWGRHGLAGAGGLGQRYTPTRVGTTIGETMTSGSTSVHPHARGDDTKKTP